MSKITQIRIIAVSVGNNEDVKRIQNDPINEAPLYKELLEACNDSAVKSYLNKLDYKEIGWYVITDPTQKAFWLKSMPSKCVIFEEFERRAILWKLQGSDQVNAYNIKSILDKMLDTDIIIDKNGATYKVPNGQIWKGFKFDIPVLGALQDALNIDSFCSDYPTLCQMIDNVDDLFNSIGGKAKGVLWLAAAAAAGYGTVKTYQKKNYYAAAALGGLTAFSGIGAYRKLKS